jgi:hypothetical protein
MNWRYGAGNLLYWSWKFTMVAIWEAYTCKHMSTHHSQLGANSPMIILFCVVAAVMPTYVEVAAKQMQCIAQKRDHDAAQQQQLTCYSTCFSYFCQGWFDGAVNFSSSNQPCYVLSHLQPTQGRSPTCIATLTLTSTMA